MKKISRAKRQVEGRGKPRHNGEADFWERGPGRQTMARMEAIRALISEGKYPNLHTIARKLEWSVRTVKRDLALMAESTGPADGVRSAEKRVVFHTAGAVLSEHSAD